MGSSWQDGSCLTQLLHPAEGRPSGHPERALGALLLAIKEELEIQNKALLSEKNKIRSTEEQENFS